MFRLKADIGPGQFDQPGAEILSAILDGATQNSAQPLEAADGKPVQERLFVGKVAKRRSVLYRYIGMATQTAIVRLM